MEYDKHPCQFDFFDTMTWTSPETGVTIKRKLKLANMHLLLFVMAKFPLVRRISEKTSGKTSISTPSGPEVTPEELHLEPGDRVVVKSMEEIEATLDGRRKTGGLYFMPNMGQFCGKEFRVLKKVQKIMLETTAEIRYIKSPTVFLEGVYCDGVPYQGCDRACLHFWREVWLKRADADSGQRKGSDSVADETE
jgi:hypothetical protein